MCVPRLSGQSVSIVWKVISVCISGLLMVVWVLSMLLK